ncbi:carotenoid oxygenase [Thelonectria olida]|uniref:Carotenoid oxygenase n=1 Tax=Thelonectria olida TaxID=1576542 RepID=A0A9P8W3B4_9HYPO|nr:carotenoid oxygenase [Thelonectria olida]
MQGRKHAHIRHSYFAGNFAPIHQTNPLTPCTYTGTIPQELQGGQYVRNGGNPLGHEHLGRDTHLFDGHGMLSGVLFRKVSPDGRIIPKFVNQYILTDVYLAQNTMSLSSPIVPSITTFVDPLAGLFKIVSSILRTLFIIIISHLPGPQQAIKRISVANTAVLYHDGRALATCENGPLMRIQLPSLDTVGWYGGEGETQHHSDGGHGLGEWTTGHPKVDSQSGEMLLYHNTFFSPYVRYSVIPESHASGIGRPKLASQAVAGVSGPSMMHDFGVSHTHTIIMDLPLTLDPTNLLKNEQVASYNASRLSRFGVFPRYEPSSVRWFTAPPCCIFHTANAWDSCAGDQIISVSLLACRMTSPKLVYSTGNVSSPKTVNMTSPDDDQCRLYYYQFNLSERQENDIAHQWALSAIPFEFPSVRSDREMQEARYIYGCSTSASCFDTALGKAAKMNVIAKIDSKVLIERGKTMQLFPTQSVDERTPMEILDRGDNEGPIQLFRLPTNHFAQEPKFVPASQSTDEDDGYLLFYVFDESQLLASGESPSTAFSELWILGAQSMRCVVARVKLFQRVPYGLHGTWFSGVDIENQRAVGSLRSLKAMQRKKQAWLDNRGIVRQLWAEVINMLAKAAG